MLEKAILHRNSHGSDFDEGTSEDDMITVVISREDYRALSSSQACFGRQRSRLNFESDS